MVSITVPAPAGPPHSVGGLTSARSGPVPPPPSRQGPAGPPHSVGGLTSARSGPVPPPPSRQGPAGLPHSVGGLTSARSGPVPPPRSRRIPHVGQPHEASRRVTQLFVASPPIDCASATRAGT